MSLGIDCGVLVSTSDGILSNSSWKCTNNREWGWPDLGFQDSHWLDANTHAAGNASQWDGFKSGLDYEWIGTGIQDDNTVFCRFSKLSGHSATEKCKQ